MPSRNLETYLAARSDGAPVEIAADMAGFSLTEARLTETAVAKGELELSTKEETTMPKNDKTPTTEPDIQLVELAADTLRGDLRDALMAWFKAQPKAWQFLTETEQKDLANAADRLSHSVIKQAAEIIARGERPTVVAKLVEYKEKDGVEAKLKLGSTQDVIQALHEACGQEVLLVTTGLENFTGEQAPAEQHAERDQADLGIGAEYENA